MTSNNIILVSLLITLSAIWILIYCFFLNLEYLIAFSDIMEKLMEKYALEDFR